MRGREPRSQSQRFYELICGSAVLKVYCLGDFFQWVQQRIDFVFAFPACPFGYSYEFRSRISQLDGISPAFEAEYGGVSKRNFLNDAALALLNAEVKPDAMDRAAGCPKSLHLHVLLRRDIGSTEELPYPAVEVITRLWSRIGDKFSEKTSCESLPIRLCLKLHPARRYGEVMRSSLLESQRVLPRV
ncbi:hypothetical protein ARTHRO9AX_130021 [Arthrobacter sp. 9AX]|nr:hypothetical protein ARTHRO9AX_130021 [Arthrobacter sp. 9AX]